MFFNLKTYLKNHVKQVYLVMVLVSPFLVFFFLNGQGFTLWGIEINNPIYNRFPAWMLVIFIFIAFSLMSFITFFVVNIFLTYKRKLTDVLGTRLQGLFIKLIISYLYPIEHSINEEHKTIDRIKRFLTSSYKKRQFLIAITRIAEDINSDFTYQFKSLVMSLKLDGLVKSLLYSANLSEKVLAMHIIYYLDFGNENYIKRIKKYSESRNFALRTESYITMIRLMKDEDQLVEFIGNKYNLSMFDIDIIVNAILNNPVLKINFIKLLSSEKKRKILVGLLLAKYKYRDNSRSLILILNQIDSESLQVKKMAWNAYLSLVPEAEGFDLIKEHYNNLDYSTRLMIIKEFEFYNKEPEIEFLDELILSEPVPIKIEALKKVFNLNMQQFIKYVEIVDPIMESVCSEVIDLNIN